VDPTLCGSRWNLRNRMGGGTAVGGPKAREDPMSVLPVIARELKAQARQPLTYWLRLVGGTALACAIAFALWTMHSVSRTGYASPFPWGVGGGNTVANPLRDFGTALFGKMNLLIFGVIWLFVPLAAADAVSRERREGTLALLYLTELRALGIVVGKNPIGWLQHYSPAARLVKWGWCLCIIAIEILFSANSDDAYDAQMGLGLLLLLGLTFSATASFREELETGAFELLLVTPIRERQIITGRVRGLWRQFLPAILVYAAGGLYLASGWNDPEYARRAWLALARIMTGFFALPLIGLYFSVRRWNFFVAWLAACLVALAPAALGRMLGATELSVSLLQLGTALVAAKLLLRRLKSREFLQRRG
jgi:ABC-type transport system involved in multi-copper enzyme maturation permease subunit